MLKEFNFMIDEHTVDADDNELIRYTDLSLVNAFLFENKEDIFSYHVVRVIFIIKRK
jgi:hypothetical protein